MSQERTNIYAVAERAGVSIATVSRVQRGVGPVSEATRVKVLEAIEELSYHPSSRGRALAKRRADATGLVFPTLSGPYYHELLTGCEQATVDAGHSLLILATHGRERAREQVFDLRDRVDGLIVMGPSIPDEDIGALQAGGAPIVLLARPAIQGIPSVRAENVAPAAELTRHLFEAHGRERLQFIGDPSCSSDAEERWQGFITAHARAGRSVAEPQLAAFGSTEGRAAAGRALDAGADALVCANDELALDAYAAAADRGLNVPEDIAVTGWDDIQLARFVSPALTTVRQPMRRLGALAAGVLFERLAGGAPSGRVEHSDVVLRASCGCEPRVHPSHPEVEQ